MKWKKIHNGDLEDICILLENNTKLEELELDVVGGSMINGDFIRGIGEKLKGLKRMKRLKMKFPKNWIIKEEDVLIGLRNLRD